MSEDLKALFRRLRKKDLAYYGNLGGSAQGGSGGGGGNSPVVADTTAPEISSAVVPAAGTTLGLTYNENLLASGDGIPDIADYSLSSGGTAVTISAVSVSGAIVTLNLARTITSGETLSFNYTAGASGRVQDAANNIASNLSSQAATNNSSATNPVSFLPSDITNLWGWYQKGTGITGSAPITNWADQSGNARDLAEATNGPALQGDGTLLFDGSNDRLRIAGGARGTVTTVCMRVKVLGWTSGDRLFDSDSLNVIALFQHTSTPSVKQISQGGANIGPVRSLPVDGAYHNVICIFKAGAYNVRIDGTDNTDAYPSFTTGTGFTLASQGDAAGSYANIQVAELAIYSQELDGTQMSDMDTYLSSVI
jgi:uncharacterized repeat protein (TIGR02059 family)